MSTLFSITTYLILLIILSKLFISKQSFFKIFIIFLTLSILIFFFFNFLLGHEIDVPVYWTLSFKILICYLLTIGLKSMSSPSEFIFELLNDSQKKFLPKDQLINYISKKKIIDLRLEDLQKQKIIKLISNGYKLTNYGKIIYLFFRILSKITTINIKG